MIWGRKGAGTYFEEVHFKRMAKGGGVGGKDLVVADTSCG